MPSKPPLILLSIWLRASLSKRLTHWLHHPFPRALRWKPSLRLRQNRHREPRSRPLRALLPI